MIAWEWTIEKARDGEEEKTQMTTRKISHTAQVWEQATEKGWHLVGEKFMRVRRLHLMVCLYCR